jgi:hypothetical protein
LSAAASRAWGWRMTERRRRPCAGGQLARVAPQAVGDLVAGAVADPRDERLLARDLVQVWIRGHDPERVQRAVDHGEPGGELVLAGLVQPGARGSPVGQGVADVDDRHPSRRHRGWLRLR